MIIPKTTWSPTAAPAQAIKNSTITAMSENMYLEFIDPHLTLALVTNGCYFRLRIPIHHMAKAIFWEKLGSLRFF
jgi:hypothetical protein